MPKEKNKVDINKHEIDIDTLFKQNVNDLSAIKELYRKLKEVEEKISQIKYIDTKLADKLKKDYEKLKKIILDENIQAKLAVEFETIKSQLVTIETTIGFLDKLKLKFIYDCKALGGATKNEIAIYNLIFNESTIYIPNGKYEIDSKILIENLDNKTIIIEENAIFNVNMTSELMANDFNVFEFKNCKNIKFIGGKCINTNTTTKVGNVNKGAFVKFINVDTFEVCKTYAENTPYDVLVFSGCVNGKVYKNQAINKPTGSQCGMSGIMVNGARYIKVYENDIIGAFRDGMLSIFGSATYEIHVYENKIISYFDRNNFDIMQGITLDQGPLNTRVYNNYIEACYYGIDVKAETKHSKVYNNTIANCKVGISDRQGEVTSVVQSYDTEIYDNLIYIDNTDLIKESYVFQPSGAYVIGIHSVDRYGSNIHDNTIIYKAPKQVVFCGIYLIGKSSMSAIYNNLYNINRNKIVLEYAFAANIFVPSDGSCGIYVNNASAFIDNNMFVTGGTTRQFSSIKYLNCWGLQITNNLFKQLGISTICISCQDTLNDDVFNTSLNGVIMGNRCSSIESSTKPQLLDSRQDITSWKVLNNIPWNT